MRLLLLALCVTLSFSSVLADDLYRIGIGSEVDATRLRQSDAEPVYRLHDGYLVICDQTEAESLMASGLIVDLVERNVEAEELVIDRRQQQDDEALEEVMFAEGNLRIRRAEPSERIGTDLVPLAGYDVRVKYRPDFKIDEQRVLEDEDLLSLIDEVERDSLILWVLHMQDYETRLTGTDASQDCGDWLLSRFQSFGYDSVYFEDFRGEQAFDYTECFSRNVVAVKPGAVYPDRHIVIGGHYDDVHYPNGIGSPGADDNASGTAGVLELARILATVETDMTFVFVAFDSEESGLWGSKNYVSDALNRGDEIFFMLNMDMLGHYGNWVGFNTRVALYGGPGIGFADMCARLSDSLLNVPGSIKEYVNYSDHDPFVQAGLDAIFVQENVLSRNLHTVRDSTTYMNFDYMRLLVQLSVATAYTANLSGPVVITQDVLDVGDGQSLQVVWSPEEAIAVDHYEVSCTDVVTSDCTVLTVSSGDTSCVVTGLSEGHEHLLHVIAQDTDGKYSLAYNDIAGVPYSLPFLPENQQASTLLTGVSIGWTASNLELDFDHYAIIRDGSLVADNIYDIVYEDWDPSLGADLHNYLVVAMDNDGNHSDTAGADWLSMKAATLQAGRILAVNRTGAANGLCDSTLTREFLLQALDGLNFDYRGDPAPHSSPGLTDLLDLVDYELVVIGAESGNGRDDIGGMMGILDQIESYIAVGGKMVAFGRWGSIAVEPAGTAITWYSDYPNSVYTTYFNTTGRTQPVTGLDPATLTMNSDFIGGHSVVPEYPPLAWDSAATVRHNGGFTFKVTDGIPCPSIPMLALGGVDTLYTYDSKNDSSSTEGRAVAWRSVGGINDYVFFDLPLSFMQREHAVYALRQAISDVGVDTGDDRDGDGVNNDIDNCPFLTNADQIDSDTDGSGDACDVCPGSDDLADADGDYVPDGCDVCPGSGDLVDHDADGVPDGCDVCPGFSDSVDGDSDGHPDGCDNCPDVANADQSDVDGDSVGDSCDICPGYDDSADYDSDTVPDNCDNCPEVANPGQEDIDGDSIGDGCDMCLGYDDLADSDGDGNPDGCDICPGYDDLADYDLDTVPDSCDNCPEMANTGQEDENENGIGDVCDGCCGEFAGGMTGNSNCSIDGMITLSDITSLIDRVYISKQELCCEENGNVNGSADGLITLSDITRLVDHVYISKGPTETCP